MSPGEAWRVIQTLLNDTTSHVAAGVAGWQYPVSLDHLVLADLFDLTNMRGVKRRPKPYPRPWPDRNKKRFGNTERDPSVVRKILRQMARGGDSE